MMNRQYVFGPVASRRLGISLGVDLVPPKTCSMDCVYCEARQTTDLTLERREYVPIEQVLRELEETLKTHPQLDYITFSGSGEPTLNAGIGRVVQFLRTRYPAYKICLLTNGYALGDPSLRREIAEIDRIVPSLDASNAKEFIRINRPPEQLKFETFLADMTDFCRTSTSEIFLELFLVPGVNDSEESLHRFVKIIEPMKVDKVQLNTLDRPGMADWVKPAEPNTVRRFLEALSPIVTVEAVGKISMPVQREAARVFGTEEMERKIIAISSRRPVTAHDLSLLFRYEVDAVMAVLDSMETRSRLTRLEGPRGVFYRSFEQK